MLNGDRTSVGTSSAVIASYCETAVVVAVAGALDRWSSWPHSVLLIVK